MKQHVPLKRVYESEQKSELNHVVLFLSGMSRVLLLEIFG